MSATSKIEWTDKTWNPTRGCSIVSPGCVNCYAMKQAHRFSGPGKAYEGLTKRTDRSGPQWTGKVVTVGSALLEPLTWVKPSRVFVNSMSDLFHDDVPVAFIRRVFDVMSRARRHTFQILTKRSERMHDVVPLLAEEHTAPDGSGWPLPNVWLGVSCEDQQRADERIPDLLQTPAAVRFVSAEPLLGPINFVRATRLASDYLDWVIVGGESGPGARPFDLAWARSIVESCKSDGVACFVKQLGADPREKNPHGKPTQIDALVKSWRLLLSDRKGGDPSEWPADLRVRQFPEVRA